MRLKLFDASLQRIDNLPQLPLHESLRHPSHEPDFHCERFEAAFAMGAFILMVRDLATKRQLVCVYCALVECRFSPLADQKIERLISHDEIAPLSTQL
ncbi:hypothetical protein [Bradyrhizobium sp.]|uniref:hypothetical protein n=1 Tax=Bradyrhizobium sp. TaxID=376 RepID=UPI0039E42A72